MSSGVFRYLVTLTRLLTAGVWVACPVARKRFGKAGPLVYLRSIFDRSPMQSPIQQEVERLADRIMVEIKQSEADLDVTELAEIRRAIKMVLRAWRIKQRQE